MNRTFWSAGLILTACGVCAVLVSPPLRDGRPRAAARLMPGPRSAGASSAAPTAANLIPRGSAAARLGDSPDGNAAREALRRRAAKSEMKRVHPFDKPREAWEFFLEQRLGPDQSEMPMARLHEELQLIRQREAAAAAQRGATPSGGITGWESLGPGNIGGRTRAIVIDPTNPSIMYAGGVAGGVWKSTDAGASWSPTDDTMLNLAVNALAMDPTNPAVLYAGTGEGYLPSGSAPFVRGLGIFKSTDSGASWSQLAGTVQGVPTGAFNYVNKIVISPNDPNRVYAATHFGVWRSSDAGATWSVVLGNPQFIAAANSSNGNSIGCTDLVVRNDRDPDVLFAAFGSFQKDGLYRSEDGGDTWLEIQTDLNQGRMSLALAPSNNDILYISMADNGLGAPVGQLVDVFRSDDGGETFTARVNMATEFGPWLLSNVATATGCAGGGVYSQGWHDNVIAVDPVNPDIVWLGGVDLFRSDDGGQNWGLAGYWFYSLQPSPPPTQLHSDLHTIDFHPQYDGVTNRTMYVGGDGGITRTDNARAATTLEECPFPQPLVPLAVHWTNMNNGYGVTQFYHGDAAAGSDLYVGGAQDNGTSRRRPQDGPNQWKLISGGDGGYVAIDPTNPQVMYVEMQGFPTIRKSTNGGDSFVPATTGITDTDGLFITPIGMDPSNPLVLWTGGSRPWRTTNGAASWQVVGPNFAGANQISAIAVAPSNGNVVYLGFVNGYVARSSNALSASPTWSVFSGLQGLTTGAWVSSIAVDPTNSSVAYCTYSTFGVAHIRRTTNAGATWTALGTIAAAGVPDIPVHSIAVRPCNSAHLYAGTELGVFVSEDTGQTWQPMNAGLAHTVVEALDFPDVDTLVAFTHGRGAFRADLTPSLTDPTALIDALLNPPADALVKCLHDRNHDGQLDADDIALFVEDVLG